MRRNVQLTFEELYLFDTGRPPACLTEPDPDGIPAYDLAWFADTVAQVEGMAERGDAQDGCNLLFLTWMHARQHEAERTWGPALVRRYTEAFEEYCRRHRIEPDYTQLRGFMRNPPPEA